MDLDGGFGMQSLVMTWFYLLVIPLDLLLLETQSSLDRNYDFMRQAFKPILYSIGKQTIEISSQMPRYHYINQARRRAEPPASRPEAPPRAASALAMGPGEVPAIQPAKSKPPPAIALLVAPVMGEARDCCSNSARISGSTGQS